MFLTVDSTAELRRAYALQTVKPTAGGTLYHVMGFLT
jgi:hypothetical protein